MNAMKGLPFRVRVRVCGLMLLLGLVVLVAGAGLYYVWTYLETRHSPHARALLSAVGERAVYLDKGWQGPALEGEGPHPWAGREHLLPRAREGLLKDVRPAWDGLAKGFCLRFKLDEDIGGLSGTVFAGNMDRLQPLERPGRMGTSNWGGRFSRRASGCWSRSGWEDGCIRSPGEWRASTPVPEPRHPHRATPHSMKHAARDSVGEQGCPTSGRLNR